MFVCGDNKGHCFWLKLLSLFEPLWVPSKGTTFPLLNQQMAQSKSARDTPFKILQTVQCRVLIPGIFSNMGFSEIEKVDFFEFFGWTF